MRRRGAFEGVGNIVRFNWPMYAVAGLALAVGGLVLRVLPLPGWVKAGARLGLGGAAFYLFGSLGVSHWVYDRSPLYGWDWLERFMRRVPRRIVNVHAGFDESSAALRERFPGSDLVVVDFYDPVRNPEPSIARARRAYPPDAATVAAGLDGWPVAGGSSDLVVLFLAAHEVREVVDRQRLFREVRRVLADEGRVVLVEHLRDAANFAAYGPGFLHFLSERTWRESFEGELRVLDAMRITPWVKAFCLAANDEREGGA